MPQPDGGPDPDVRRGASREDPRDPRLPQARDPLLRHHDAPEGPRRLQGIDRPDARALQGRADRPRGRDGVAWLHLQRPDGVPARSRSRAGPQAGQAAGRDHHGRIRPRVRLEHARDPSRRDPGGPARPDRRRPARDRRHGQGDDRAGRAAAAARSPDSRSWSSSTSSRVAIGWTAVGSPASSSTEPDGRGRSIVGAKGRAERRAERRAGTDPSHRPDAPAATEPRLPPRGARPGATVPRRPTGARRSTSGVVASSASSPASSSRPPRRSPAPRRPSSAPRPRRPARSSTRAGAAALRGRRPRREPPTPSAADRLPDAVPRGRRGPLPDRPAPAARTPSSRSSSARPPRSPTRSARWSSAARPAIGQVAAIGLALTADRIRDVAPVRPPGDAARRAPTRSSTPARRPSTCAGRSTG